MGYRASVTPARGQFQSVRSRDRAKNVICTAAYGRELSPGGLSPGGSRCGPGGGGHHGGIRGDLKVQDPAQCRGVSILHEKWCNAS
uniref:Uncharacterized protein n=1 Tax=Knipowitschia caucasica TaxID=637954 RepID=A0AAV2L8T6_KNICA